MPRSTSRSARKTEESSAEKPSTRRSLRAVASPPPQSKPSPAAASRGRSQTKSPAAPAAKKTLAVPARSRGRAATKSTPEPTTPETKPSPAAAKGRSCSAASQKPSTPQKKPATPAAKGGSAKVAETKATKSPAKSRSGSVKKAAPSPKKKESPSPKKSSSKKAAAAAKKSPKKTTPKRSRSTGRRGKQEAEGEKEAEDEQQGEETKSEEELEAEKPDNEAGVAVATSDLGKDQSEEEMTATDVATVEKDKEIETTALAAEPSQTDDKLDVTDSVTTEESRKRKRDEDDVEQVSTKVLKISDDAAEKTSTVDAFAEDGEGRAVETASDVVKAPREDAKESEKIAESEKAMDVDDGDDYILISTDDVPAADSDEMQQVAAKMCEPFVAATVAAVATDGCDHAANGCGEEDPLLSREYVANSAVAAPGDPSARRSFSLVSYNILADCHAVKDYVGERAPWISDEQLAMSVRHRRIMDELGYMDADVICLQEVGGDYMTQLLQPALETRGYKGVFIPRNTKAYSEGEATFYRTSRFSLVSSEGLVLSDLINAAVDESICLEADKKELVKAALATHAVAMLTRLQDVNTGDCLSVANIHVVYDKLQRQDRQCIQLATAVQKLVKFAGGVDKPHIICGDFNSWPGTPPYQLMTDGSLNDSSLVALQAIESIDVGEDQCIPVVNLWCDGFQFPVGGDLKSSYKTVVGVEPLTSRYAADASVMPVDYIWFSSVSLDVLGVLQTVKQALFESGIPSTVFPSDHLSIKARFAFK